MTDHIGIEMLRNRVAQKDREKLAREMTHEPFVDPFHGVAENFALGVYEAPGLMMEGFDWLKGSSPLAMAVEHFYPTETSSRAVVDDLMNLGEMEQAFDVLGPYGATEALQGAARFSGQMIDPLAIGGAGVDLSRMAARGIPWVLNEMAGTVGGSPMRMQSSMSGLPQRTRSGESLPDPDAAYKRALGMKSEEMFDPAGIDYQRIYDETGVWIGPGDRPESALFYGPGRRQRGALTYHGSPHEFTQFDHSAMGSGEGAQAYGWGTNLAESKDVAGTYRADLTYGGQGALEIPGLPPAVNRQIARDFAGSDYSSIDEIPPEWYDNIVDDLRAEGADDLADQLAAADKSKARLTKGHLYTVDVPDEKIARMLDWNAPLKNQPAEVQAAVRAELARLDENDIGYGLTHYFNGRMEDVSDEMLSNFDDWNGGMVQKVLEYNYDKQGASEALRRAGIPGIKYYDADSRMAVSNEVEYPQALERMSAGELRQEAYEVLGIDPEDITDEDLDDWVIPDLIEADKQTTASRVPYKAGSRTRNLVVFDESDMKVLERNGEPVGGELQSPWIGYVGKTGKSEHHNFNKAYESDFHHSHAVDDLWSYDEEDTLRYVRMGYGDPENPKGGQLLDDSYIEVTGEPALDLRRGRKQLTQMADEMIAKGADPNLKVIVGDMGLNHELEGAEIGTLGSFASKNTALGNKIPGQRGAIDWGSIIPELETLARMYPDPIPGQISTRMPGAKSSTPEDVMSHRLMVGMDEMRLAPQYEQRATGLLTPYTPGLSRYRNPRSIQDAWMDFSTKNLDFLFNQFDEPTRMRAAKWYEGANRISKETSQKFDIPERAAAGVYAALSPQKDWFMNVSLGDRVIDIWKNQQNTPWDKVMQAKYDELNKGGRFDKYGISGKKLSDLKDKKARGLWIRVFDEANNPRNYDIISPEGDRVAPFMTKGGEGPPGTAAWGSLEEIGSAVSVLDDPSLENISREMGGAHKVRNFYNNIFAPNSKRGEITGDTHHINATMLMPMGGTYDVKKPSTHGNLPVTHALGAGASNAPLGLQGTYPLHMAPAQELARQKGLLPRQIQSITWEAVRGLFDNKSEPIKRKAKAIWGEYSRGKISQEQAQELILELAGGVNPPSWVVHPPLKAAQ